MAKKLEIKWWAEPEAHDYPAAQSYLSLLYEERTAGAFVRKLKRAGRSEFKAKDIFRAAGLPLLGSNNSHVIKDRKNIGAGKRLSPLLLVRAEGKVLIADGYHRLCAVYSFEEDALIPCKIV